MSNKKSYSQVGQDLFVLSLFPEGYKGTFLDFGCQEPKKINNTLLLEEHGWDGFSLDIVDYSEQWETRDTYFICMDVLKESLSWLKASEPYDYISLDISPYGGARFELLKRIIDLGIDFKVLTIEHDAYIEGNDELERKPQRELLNSLGYVMTHGDVSCGGNLFEDWWINPKYIDYEKIRF